MDDGATLLDVEAAAQKLGVSTMRVRQMIRDGQLDAVRDNRGRWRLRAPVEIRPRPPRAAAGGDAAAIELLIDEIMELRTVLAERERAFGRLRIVADRQHEALERALAQLGEARKRGASEPPLLRDQRDRALAAAERAVVLLDRKRPEATLFSRMSALMDRALRLLDRGGKS